MHADRFESGKKQYPNILTLGYSYVAKPPKKKKDPTITTELHKSILSSSD